MGVARGQPIDQYASPAYGMNSTAISDTTARTVLAAVSAKSYYITQAKAINRTAGTIPVILVKDGTNTLFELLPGDPAAGVGGNVGGDTVTFNPPLKTTAGGAVTGEATTATGSSQVFLNGYLED